MFQKFDPNQTQQFINEANDIVSIVGTVISNEGSTLASKDIYSLVERLERAQYLLLTVGDRKYHEETKVVA